MTTCDSCGTVLEVGMWPFCPDHGKPERRKGFEPYFDEGLGAYIETAGDRNKLLRPHWENDHIVHLQPRDKSDQYYRELNDRRMERAEAEKRERR